MVTRTTATDVCRHARRFGVALVIASAGVSLAGVARAEGPSSAQESEADALFSRANELVAKKDFAAACPLFEQAYHLAGGGGTAQNLAICYEDLGKVASAYRAYAELRRVSLVAPVRPDRVRLAEERMARLEPRLSRLRVRVPEARKVPDWLVTVDGDTYGDKALADGIAVDVGTHAVKLTAPGKKPLEIVRVVAREGATEIVEIPETDAAPVEAPLAPQKDDREASRHAMRTGGLVLGGAGLVTIFAGGVFAILTATRSSAASDACRDPTPDGSLSNKGPTDDPSKMFDAAGHCYASTPARPNPYLEESNRIRDEARTYGTVATFMVPIGIAAVATGTYLVLASRPEPGPAPKKTARSSPMLLPTLGGVVFVGELP